MSHYRLLSLLSRAEVAIVQADDKSVEVKTGVYTARINGAGNLTEFNVNGAPLFTHNFVNAEGQPFPDVTVNLVNQMVAVRSGDARTEWTFGEDQVSVLSEGFNFECQLDSTLKTVLVAGGKSRPYDNRPDHTATGGVIGLVLKNNLTALSVVNGQAYPMHVHCPRIFPNIYTNGFGKLGQLVEWTWKLGGSAGVAQTLTGIEVKGIGADEKMLQTSGNQGQGLVHFPDGVPVAFGFSQINQSEKEPIGIDYQVEIWDHYIWMLPHFKGTPGNPADFSSHRRFKHEYPVTIAPGKTSSVACKGPELDAGFYYLHMSAWRNGGELTEEVLPFAVNLPGFKPKRSRPADFAEFWEHQEQTLAEIPSNPQVTKISGDQLTGQMWEVVGDMRGNRKFHALYEIPAAKSAYVLMTARLPHDLETMKAAATTPEWSSTATMPTLWLPLIDGATYTQWTSANENNLLDNILLTLRGVDYLKSRPDVKPHSIRLFGASRSGPLVLIAAARRPNDIAGVAAHVHTSCGIGWTDKPYYGWGIPGGNYNVRDASKVAAFAAMAAYVDPVNHAEDVRCPMTFAYGVSDWGLSPPEGIEAAYVLCASKWKRISRDAGGHVYTPGTIQINKELDEFLRSVPAVGNQDRILKDH